MHVLDSGAVTRFAFDAPAYARARRAVLGHADQRFAVPSAVLVECLTGIGPRDARVNAFLKECEVVEIVPLALARRAALLRTRAQRGSAVDALVVAPAEAGGIVFTSDHADLAALAAHARDVSVEAI